jgi:hypothetical protein
MNRADNRNQQELEIKPYAYRPRVWKDYLSGEMAKNQSIRSQVMEPMLMVFRSLSGYRTYRRRDTASQLLEPMPVSEFRQHGRFQR